MPGSRSNRALRFWQAALFVAFLAFWHVATSPTLLPPFYFDNPHKAAFFFREPLKVLARTCDRSSSGTIYPHLSVTLVETVLAFAICAVVGEYLGSSRGVGYLILQAEGTFDINSVFAGILVLTAFALLLDWVVSLAERRLLVWQPRGGETEKM